MTDERSQLRDLASRFTAAAEVGTDPTEPAPEPTEPTEAPEPAPEPARAPAAGRTNKTKTSLNLPEKLAVRLRAWRDDTGRSHGDAIISALIAEMATLRASAASDAERIELGLAPLVAGHAGNDRELVTFWATAAALDRLDEAAASMSMTRSALIAALLDLYLP